jgi:hypothetical protein
MKYTVILSLFFAFTTQAANYTDAALEIGFRQQNGSVDAPADANAKSGYQVGVSGAFPISDSLSFRSGLFYVEKSIESETSPTAKEDLKFTYFQVPAALLFKFMDYAGVYAGVNLEFNLGDDCGTNNCQDVQSMTTPIVLGATFKFLPQMGANVFFESGSGEVADGVKDFRAVGANLMITFD